MMGVLLNIELTRVLEPKDLPALVEAVEKEVKAGDVEGIVISGRLPVWAFAALVHLFHPRPWVATFDPRLNAGVVVATHVRYVNIGDLISPDEVPLHEVTVKFGD